MLNSFSCLISFLNYSFSLSNLDICRSLSTASDPWEVRLLDRQRCNRLGYYFSTFSSLLILDYSILISYDFLLETSISRFSSAISCTFSCFKTISSDYSQSRWYSLDLAPFEPLHSNLGVSVNFSLSMSLITFYWICLMAYKLSFTSLDLDIYISLVSVEFNFVLSSRRLANCFLSSGHTSVRDLKLGFSFYLVIFWRMASK